MNTNQEPSQESDKSLKEKEDQLLWEFFRKRNERVVAYIIDTNYGMLQKYGQRFSNKKELIEDCVQEVFCDLLENAHNLKDVKTIGPFLRRCLIYKILKKEKRYKIETPQSLLDRNTLESINFDVPDESDNRDLEEDVKLRLHTACNCLSDRERQAFHLRFFENRRFKEIAAIMGMEIQYTQTLFYRGMKKLKENYKKLCPRLKVVR